MCWLRAGELHAAHGCGCTTRAAPGDAWADPLPFDEINTSANDSDPWMSPDGHTFVFVSDKDGSSQMYMATR